MTPERRCVPACAPSTLAFTALAKRRLVIDLDENDPATLDTSPPHCKRRRPNDAPTLDEIVGSKLCPKQTPTAIGEFMAIADSLRKASALRWASKKLSKLFVILRGVRGENGVNLSSKAIFEHGWDIDSPDGIRAFGNHMVAMYNHSVGSGSEPRSFLSHAEALHSGLSGIHFLRTLGLEEQLELIENLAGQLTNFWDKAVAHQIQSTDLLQCYETFGSSRLMLYCTTDETKKYKQRRLRKNSYNAMDFFRSFYETCTIALGHPKVLPSEKLWVAVLKAQKHTAEVDQMMLEYGLAEYGQVRRFLQNSDAVTWTTLLVLCCEVRQAKKALSARAFHGLVRRILADQERLLPEVLRHTAEIQADGAKSKDCFCTRLCLRMRGACTKDGDDIE